MKIGIRFHSNDKYLSGVEYYTIGLLKALTHYFPDIFAAAETFIQIQMLLVMLPPGTDLSPYLAKAFGMAKTFDQLFWCLQQKSVSPRLIIQYMPRALRLATTFTQVSDCLNLCCITKTICALRKASYTTLCKSLYKASILATTFEEMYFCFEYFYKNGLTPKKTALNHYLTKIFALAHAPEQKNLCIQICLQAKLYAVFDHLNTFDDMLFALTRCTELSVIQAWLPACMQMATITEEKNFCLVLANEKGLLEPFLNDLVASTQKFSEIKNTLK